MTVSDEFDDLVVSPYMFVYIYIHIYIYIMNHEQCFSNHDFHHYSS